MSLHAERGPMVLDDLRALGSAPLVIAEGTVLPAAGVGEPGAGGVAAAAACSGRAARGRAGRPGDRGRGARARRPGRAPEDVEARFAAAIAAGPRAQGRGERQALLRGMNEAVAQQVRGYFRRWWAQGDPAAVERDFACECGDPDCLADVRAPVGRLGRGR